MEYQVLGFYVFVKVWFLNISVIFLKFIVVSMVILHPCIKKVFVELHNGQAPRQENSQQPRSDAALPSALYQGLE